MKIGKFGDLIHYERTKFGISVEKLAEGLCAKTVLRRIEAGEREVDFFLLERLLGRLGSSINKMEVLQDIKDYRVLMMREYIGDALSKKEYERAESFLSEYEEAVEKDHDLHLQYILMVKMALELERGKDKAVLRKHLID